MKQKILTLTTSVESTITMSLDGKGQDIYEKRRDNMHAAHSGTGNMKYKTFSKQSRICRFDTHGLNFAEIQWIKM